jgi:hypothetical protein
MRPRRPRRSPGSVEIAGRHVRAGGDELYEGAVVSGGDVADLIHQQSAHAFPPVGIGHGEHRHLDDGVAVGEVRFDPEARYPHDPVLALGHQDAGTGFFEEFLQPLADCLFPGQRVAHGLCQLAGECVDLQGVLDGRLPHVVRGSHALPRFVACRGTYPTQPGGERMQALR